jgi:antitoxin Phd
MQINIDNLVSISEANQNFSKVARLVDDKGPALIMKNNHPKYALLDMGEYRKFLEYQENNFSSTADRILTENIEAFKELAK